MFKTEQEQFWAGKFGVEYIKRNQGKALLASNLNFFSNALRGAKNINSCIEFGANIGMNIGALRLLYPDMEIHGIEINSEAVKSLQKVLDPKCVYHTSILEFQPTRTWDLVLIKGVLIHINPDELQNAYAKLAASCTKYLLVAEYYNPTPVSVAYRGHKDRLFKRDFAAEIMNCHPQFCLVDYGFSYRRDPKFPQDDITWFLMENAAV